MDLNFFFIHYWLSKYLPVGGCCREQQIFFVWTNPMDCWLRKVLPAAAVDNQQSIIFSNYPYEPVYYLEFNYLLARKVPASSCCWKQQPFMWNIWINSEPTYWIFRHTWSHADLVDSVGWMEYRQHTIIGEKLIGLIMFELYLYWMKILTIFIWDLLLLKKQFNLCWLIKVIKLQSINQTNKQIMNHIPMDTSYEPNLWY